MMIELYKDQCGNLWYHEGFDKETKMHKVVVVDSDKENYIYTHITCYMTEKEFGDLKNIQVDVDLL